MFVVMDATLPSYLTSPVRYPCHSDLVRADRLFSLVLLLRRAAG